MILTHVAENFHETRPELTFQNFAKLVCRPHNSNRFNFCGGDSSICQLSEKVYIVWVIFWLGHTFVAWREYVQIWPYLYIRRK